MFSILLLVPVLGKILGTYAGSNEGNAYGYGYSGSYSGSGNPPFNFGILNGYLDSLRKYHEHFLNSQLPYSYTIASSSSNANAQAHSSIKFVNNNRNFQQLGEQLGTYTQELPSYAPPVYKDSAHVNKVIPDLNRIDGSAMSFASLGPQGAYQTAAVFPENPNSPNIYSRFAEGFQDQQTGGKGSYGVFTSSISSSSNVGGNSQNFHKATTTVNDNGKVSTYTVTNP